MKAERKVFRREVLHYEEIEYHCCERAMEKSADQRRLLLSDPPKIVLECHVCGKEVFVPHGEGGFVMGPREEVK